MSFENIRPFSEMLSEAEETRKSGGEEQAKLEAERKATEKREQEATRRISELDISLRKPVLERVLDEIKHEAKLTANALKAQGQKTRLVPNYLNNGDRPDPGGPIQTFSRFMGNEDNYSRYQEDVARSVEAWMIYGEAKEISGSLEFDKDTRRETEVFTSTRGIYLSQGGILYSANGGTHSTPTLLSDNSIFSLDHVAEFGSGFDEGRFNYWRDLFVNRITTGDAKILKVEEYSF